MHQSLLVSLYYFRRAATVGSSCFSTRRGWTLAPGPGTCEQSWRAVHEAEEFAHCDQCINAPSQKPNHV